MARVKGQNIPSIFKLMYAGSLAPAVFTHTTYHNKYNTRIYNQTKYRSAYYVRRRTPFRMPSRQGRDDIHSATVKEIASPTAYLWRRGKRGYPSAAQLWVRNTFCKGAACFREQPATGGWDGESSGPRGRDWWYALSQGTGLYYYPNFMSQTLTPLFGSKKFDWWAPLDYSVRVRGSDGQSRWPHLYIKTDEADFLTFYTDMAALYGWSWNAGSDPDVIAHTMCKTVYDEITVMSDGLHDIWRTPGETGALGAGDCEDKGMLTYAMIWKTLKGIGKSDIYINNRLRCIGYYDGDIGHCVGIWKDNNGTDRALPTTGAIGDPGASISDCKLLENVIGKTALYQWDKSKTRFPYTKGVPYTPEWCHDYTKNIYVADFENNRVQSFNNRYVSNLIFGEKGSEPGQFSSLYDVTVYGNKIFTTDKTRIQVFDLAGNFLYSFGSSGSGDGQFNTAFFLHVANDKIYVTDYILNRIQVFDLDGIFLFKFGSPGTSDGQFSGAAGIFATTSRVYVVDGSGTGHRVQIFFLDGGYADQFGSKGSGEGQLNAPRGISVTPSRIYIADTLNHRIQSFNLGGEFTSEFGTLGTGAGQFQSPISVSYAAGKLFVSDTFNNRIQVFDTTGKHIITFGWLGSNPGQLNTPAGIFVTTQT